MTLELVDAPEPWSPHLSAFRECYRGCRDAGGDEFECREQCADLEGSDLTSPTIRGPCVGYWDCFFKGFEVPESVRELPGTIGGIARDVISPINATLALAIGAGLVFLWLRRGS